VLIGFKTSPHEVDWSTLDATWATARELGVFDSAWSNDHLSHPGQERYGSSFEAFTMIAALAHRVPGLWVGHTVLANTFRHPSVLAKSATTMDHVTGGRFILGLGAGWHQWEHEAFGVELPPIGERIDRLESATRIYRALMSDEARQAPGVTLDSHPWPLRGATNEPAPLTPGGPPLWLGGQKRRGFELAARYADGWNFPASAIPSSRDSPFDEFLHRRDQLLAACEKVGRDPSTLTISVQLRAGDDRDGHAVAVEHALGYAREGCGHLILTVNSAAGPDGLRAAAEAVVAPIREKLGTGPAGSGAPASAGSGAPARNHANA
jgi:alkanesulfonate monooxygenase SsuD/methylene tetrahydromethanopterin reductase-like flavin-dependent oxidoreductase (luciferase family)